MTVHPISPRALKPASTTSRVWPSSQSPVEAFHATEPYAGLLAADIRGFGDQDRDDDVRLALRKGLYATMADAFAMTTLPWDTASREDRGDGVFLVLPPSVPIQLLLDPLAHHLVALLRRHNRGASDGLRLRLRLAVHAGRVIRDEHGVVGRASIHLFRLLEARAFKVALKAAGADLGVIVSNEVFTEVAERGGLLNAAAYRNLRIACKDTRTTAWTWFPHN
jgi:hypothetical protein